MFRSDAFSRYVFFNPIEIVIRSRISGIDDAFRNPTEFPVENMIPELQKLVRVVLNDAKE